MSFHALKVFDQVWVMTRGGPGGATETILTFIYTNVQINVGVASAASILLFAVGLAISILRFRKGEA
ncbi:hypothetical protein [Micromonospora globbae]|uniref:hypothetical protein n=1 Tax=Micromonospora globbae TaxID=1894969 RepID=UPI003446EB18